MKHLAIIQHEFLKQSRRWKDMSLKDQRDYLKRHPKSKRRLTARPSGRTEATTPFYEGPEKKRRDKRKPEIGGYDPELDV